MSGLLLVNYKFTLSSPSKKRKKFTRMFRLPLKRYHVSLTILLIFSPLRLIYCVLRLIWTSHYCGFREEMNRVWLLVTTTNYSNLHPKTNSHLCFLLCVATLPRYSHVIAIFFLTFYKLIWVAAFSHLQLNQFSPLLRYRFFRFPLQSYRDFVWMPLRLIFCVLRLIRAPQYWRFWEEMDRV